MSLKNQIQVIVKFLLAVGVRIGEGDGTGRDGTDKMLKQEPEPSDET